MAWLGFLVSWPSAFVSTWDDGWQNLREDRVVWGKGGGAVRPSAASPCPPHSESLKRTLDYSSEISGSDPPRGRCLALCPPQDVPCITPTPMTSQCSDRIIWTKEHLALGSQSFCYFFLIRYLKQATSLRIQEVYLVHFWKLQAAIRGLPLAKSHHSRSLWLSLPLLWKPLEFTHRALPEWFYLI